MNKSVYILVLILISIGSFGQKVIRNEQECLDNYNDINNLGGKFQVKDYLNDTTFLDFWTYGPCNATMKISVKNLMENNAVDLKVENVSDQVPDNNCLCMFVLNSVIVGVKSPKSKGWVIRNETMPRKEWDKWFWDKL